MENRKPGRRPTGEKSVVVNLVLKPEHRERLESAADQRGVTMSQVVRECLDRHLEAEGE